VIVDLKLDFFIAIGSARNCTSREKNMLRLYKQVLSAQGAGIRLKYGP